MKLPEKIYLAQHCFCFASIRLLCCQSKEIPCRLCQAIGQFLLGTCCIGHILQPDINQSFLMWVNTDFVGSWNQQTTGQNIMTAKSRSGYLKTHYGCSISWASKMQAEITLSTTKRKYVSESNTFQETIPIMCLIQEFKHKFECAKFMCTHIF